MKEVSSYEDVTKKTIFNCPHLYHQLMVTDEIASKYITEAAIEATGDTKFNYTAASYSKWREDDRGFPSYFKNLKGRTAIDIIKDAAINRYNDIQTLFNL